MRKELFFAAAVVAMVACNKTESTLNISSPQEVGFMTIAQNETRGYVWSDVFKEVTNPDTLTTAGKGHNASVAASSEANHSYREMVVSAFNDSDKEDYFKAKTFKRKPTDGIWHNYDGTSESPIYWPIGKDLQFLAYSSSNVTTTDATIDPNKSLRLNPDAIWENAKKVSFNVLPYQCYQNDILFAEAAGNNRGDTYTGYTAADGSNSKNGLAIKFYHAQAWLTFNVTFVGTDAETLTDLNISSIVLKDVFNSGVLTLEYKGDGTKKPSASWDFFTQNPSDVKVDDPWGVLKNANLVKTSEDVNGIQLNMLMPEQKHGEKFVLNYSMNGVENSVPLPFNGTFDEVSATSGTPAATDLDSAEILWWKMGYHYIYNITISINELTFAPEVNVWTEVKGFTADQAL